MDAMKSFKYELLYQHMLAALSACKEERMPAAQKIEQCFQVAYLHTYRLAQSVCVRSLRFEDEICFFKYIKPVFTVEMDYYLLRYHAALFLPDREAAIRKFWERERLRLERFREEQAEFYQYYQNGSTARDHYYFRASPGISPRYSFGDFNSSFFSVGDALVSWLLALERYCSFVATQTELPAK
jgi:hypothetical protein